MTESLEEERSFAFISRDQSNSTSEFSFPELLIGPMVSKASGWKMHELVRFAYLSCFLVEASSAAWPATDKVCVCAQELANVGVGVTSNDRALLSAR